MHTRDLRIGLRFMLLMAAGTILLPFSAQTQTSADNKNPAQTVSKKPLSDEQLIVYRDFLKIWRPTEVQTLNLSITTDALDRMGSDGDDGCLKDFDAEAMTPNIVHRFTVADVNKLGPGVINLVDRVAQDKEVEVNDPLNRVQKGDSVENAVRNGFNHGLFIFSEIQFDKTHAKAILTYTFYCGQQCGNGGTVVLSKSTGMWLVISRCHQWLASVKQVRKPEEDLELSESI
jgi:hypothetical protein